MNKGHALGVAPSRDGKQIALAWRFWAQGDEFYAASRDAIKLGKISFHKNFNWQYRLGDALFPLARPLRLSDDWLHAVQLSFLVKAGVLLPLSQGDTRVSLVDVPVGAKLVLNLLVSLHTRKPMLTPPAQIGGAVILSHRLRGGTSLIMTYRILEMDTNDLSVIDDIQAKLRINFTSLPDSSEVFAEAVWHQFDARTGNTIVVVPVRYEAIQGDSL